MSAAAPLRLAFAGGGTGGHVVPGLHLLDALRGGAGLSDLLWFGSGRAVEEHALGDLSARLGGAPHERIALALEPAGGGAPSMPALALRLAPAVRAARRALRRHRTDVVLGLGGFTTVPVVLAARSVGLPVALLEINAVPGRATRWLGRLAREVYHAWPATLPARVAPSRFRPAHLVLGPPLGPDFAAARAQREALARGDGGSGVPRLLVLGGSQGALGLNRFIAAHAEALLAAGLEVQHQVGPGRSDEAAPPLVGYTAVEYLADVPAALAAATLVLCRGGASTLAEVAAVGVPALVVPYPHHPDRHQERNARQLGAGVRVVPEATLGPGTVEAIVRLCAPASRGERGSMTAALHAAVPVDAAERIAARLRALAAGAPRG